MHTLPRTLATLLLSVVAGAVLLSQSAAAETRLPVHGWSDGSFFRSNCSGDFVVGIYVKSGVLVDAIGLKCAAFDPAKGKFKEPAWNKAFHGGQGGGHQEALCPSGDFHVGGIKFGFTHENDVARFVDYVELTCNSLSGGRPITLCLQTEQGCWNDRLGGDPGFLAVGRQLLLPFVEECPSGEAAIGISGRAHRYVTALGLICGPKPVVATPVADDANLMPRAALSSCIQWDLSRVPEWVLNQKNGYYLWMTFQQHDQRLGGRARYQSQGYENPQGAQGDIVGTVKGNVVEFTVRWSNGSSGIYTGTVRDDGNLGGQTRDAAGGQSVDWNAEQGKAVCIAEGTPPPVSGPTMTPSIDPSQRPLRGGDQTDTLKALGCGQGMHKGADGQCYPDLH